MLLGELAERLGGRLEYGASSARCASDTPIHGIGVPEDCRAGEIVYAQDRAKYALALAGPCAAVIIGEGIEPESKPCIVVRDARAAFIACLEIFAPPPPRHEGGVSAGACVRGSASVAPSAVVMERASVLDGAFVGERSVLWPGVFIGADARVGQDCVLHPNVVIRERCVVGDRVIIHAGAVIGADGFGYARALDGAHRKIPQIGDVVVGDDVEIGANSTIDRATCGSTRIGRGTKIDNLVQVAHNVTIGEDALLAAQVGIAGSVTIGDSCVFAGQSGIADHCSIGDRALIGPQAGVQRRHIPSGSVYMGTPAIEMKKFQRIIPYLHRLPELLGKKRVPQTKDE